MTTLWEMAAAIREQESLPQMCSGRPSANARDMRIAVDMGERMEFWCRVLDTTQTQLFRAIAHVGTDARAVRGFLDDRFALVKPRARVLVP